MTADAVLSVADYCVFFCSLLLCTFVGIYYLLPDSIRQADVLQLLRCKCVSPSANRDNNNGQGDDTNNGNRTVEQQPMAMATNRLRQRRAAAEYFLGGRHLSFLPVVLSLFATNFSAVGMLGLPAEVYTVGTAPILSTMSFIPASILISLIFIPIYYRGGFNSIFEYLEKRFNSVLLRKIATTVSAFSTIAYCAVCAYIPCVAFEQASGISEWILVIATGFVTVFYTAVGGLRAVIVVDALQAGIMLAGIVSVLIVGSNEVGGISNAWEIASKSGRTTIYDWRVDLTVTHSFWSIFCGAGFFFFAATNNQSTLQRSCSLDSLPKAILSLICVGPLAALLSVILWLTTLTAFAYFSTVVGCDPFKSGAVKSPNQIMSYFVSVVMTYPGFRGLYFACLFSGSLSTLSTSFNSVSSVIWEDWLKDPLESRLSSRQVSLSVKLLATLIGIITCLLALSCKYIGGTAIRMVTSFTSAFSGTILAVFLAAAFLPFITAFSLIIGVVLSVPFVLTVIIGQLVYKLSSYPWLPMAEHGCLNSTVGTVGLFTFDGDINSTNLTITTTTPALAMTSTTHAADSLNPVLRSLFSLSYNYFPVLCIVSCLGIASFISAVSWLLSKTLFPGVAMLRPPSNINPSYMAINFQWIQPYLPGQRQSISASRTQAGIDGSNDNNCLYEKAIKCNGTTEHAETSKSVLMPASRRASCGDYDSELLMSFMAFNSGRRTLSASETPPSVTTCPRRSRTRHLCF